MADPNIFKNPFISAYIGTLNEESPFYKGAAPTTGFEAYGKPTSDLYNYDIGPTADPLFKEESGLRQRTDDYLGSLFQPAQTTEDYVAANPLTERINIPSSSGVIGRPQAENTAQAGKRQSNYIQDAHDAVMDLMKGGMAIPRSLAEPEPGSGKASGLDLSRYAGVDRDIRGNIIGLTARMQYDPVSGAPTRKIGTDWQAKTGERGNPYTPGLDAFKQAQSQESIAKAQTNKQQYASALSRATGYKSPEQVQIESAAKTGPKITEAFKQTKKQGEMIA